MESETDNTARTRCHDCGFEVALAVECALCGRELETG